MTDDLLKIKIEGDLAEKHMVPLFETGESLSGLGMCFTRVSHYLLTSKVRRKGPYDDGAQILISPPKSNCVEFDFINLLQVAAPTTVFGVVTLNITSNIIMDLTTHVLKRLTGKDDGNSPKSIQPLVDQRSGDIDALADAIHSNVVRSHTVIKQGANSISITGNNNIIVFDSQTKDYVKSTIKREDQFWIDASIGRLNSNDDSAGAYIPEYGRVIQSYISPDISPEAKQIVADSNSLYFIGKKEESKIKIFVSPSVDISGNVKSYLLLDAQKIDPFEE